MVFSEDTRRFIVARWSSSAVTSASRAEVAEQFLVSLGREPVVVDGIAVLVALSTVSQAEISSHAREEQLPQDKAFYRSQMARAVEAFEALTADRLMLAYQAIRSPGDDELFYREALARIIPTRSEEGLVAPGSFIPALEQLGLVRLFDRAVVLEAIASLQRLPSLRLGCNISGQSTIDDEYWCLIFATLAAHPQLATRLVIEITETSALPDPKGAAQFVAKLKRLGCQVALDDFGAGFSSISQALLLGPDIIKIDAGLLREATRQIFGGGWFSALVNLCASLAGQVVVEGVEGEEDVAAVRRSGAGWVQGYYVDRPSIGWGDNGDASSVPPFSRALKDHEARTVSLTSAGALENGRRAQ